MRTIRISVILTIMFLMLAFGQEPQLKITGAQPTYLLLLRTEGKLLVGIHPDGKIDYGEKYKPDTAAKLFWESVGLAVPKCDCAKLGPEKK